MEHLSGMVIATITPMRENGTVDEKSAVNLCDYLSENGVRTLYPNGTNGESLLLHQDERMQMAEAFVKGSRGRFVLYIQCGALTTAETFLHVRHAGSIGADGAGIMTPAFFPVDEAGMEQYYDGILGAFPGLPMYLYNIPSRSGNDISAALLGCLMQRHENLLGIKYSFSDLLRVGQYAACCARRPDVLIGCDSLALCCLMAGGSGYVSGPGAVFPKTYASIYHAFAAGNHRAAQEAQRIVLNLQSQLDGIPEIPAIKYALWKKDVIATPICRKPLRELDLSEKRRLDAVLSVC